MRNLVALVLPIDAAPRQFDIVNVDLNQVVLSESVIRVVVITVGVEASLQYVMPNPFSIWVQSSWLSTMSIPSLVCCCRMRPINLACDPFCFQ